MESYELLQKELDMIHHFYQDNEASVLQQEIDAAAKRLAPEIIHETINGGIFYLAESFLNELMKKSLCHISRGF